MDTNFDATSLAGHDLWAARLPGDTAETAPPSSPQAAPDPADPGRQAGRLDLPVETRALWVNRWEFNTPDDIRRLADKAAGANFNALFFQVRGNADACYASGLEPWTARLSGGALGDDPGWDPLAVAVEEAHARGLELHAWFNVYPAWLGETPPPPVEPEPMFLRFNRLLRRPVAGLGSPPAAHAAQQPLSLVQPGPPGCAGAHCSRRLRHRVPLLRGRSASGLRALSRLGVLARSADAGGCGPGSGAGSQH